MRRMSLILAVMILLLGGSVLAQGTTESYLLYHDNTLFRWSEQGGLQQIGQPVPQSEFISMSPSGQYFIYRILTEMAQKTLLEECPCGGGDFPSNIWAIDTNSGTPELIAGQSPEATETVLEITRSNPVWSPDGSKLAWIEGVEGQDLVIYDFATKQTSKFAEDFPIQALASNTPALSMWTQTGILMVGDDYNDQLQPSQSRYVFFGTDGGVVANVTSAYLYPRTFSIVTENGRELLLINDHTNWSTIDLTTGASTPLTGGSLIAYMAGEPTASLRMSTVTWDEQGLSYREIYNPDGSLLAKPSSVSGFFVFTGPRTLQYDTQGATRYIWRPDADGGPFTIELPWEPLVMFWKPAAYELRRGGTQVIAQARCEGGNLPFRLYDDPKGYVLGDTANNLRSEPGSASTLVGQIPAGEIFTMTGGPQCRSGVAWWPVTYGELQGWTAEGEGDTYWVAPGCGPDGCAAG